MLARPHLPAQRRGAARGQRRTAGPALGAAHNQRLSPPNRKRATSSASCSPSRSASRAQTHVRNPEPAGGSPQARLPTPERARTRLPSSDPLSHTRRPHGVRGSHRRRLGRGRERGFGRKADSVPMRGALLRRRKRPVRGAGRQAGRGGRARRRADRREVWRGRGGRREERLCGSLVVRHEILGVGPKHRLVLEGPAKTNTTRRGKKKTDKRERERD